MGPQQGRIMDPMAGGGGMMPGNFNQGYQAGPQGAAMMSGGIPPQSSFMSNQSAGQPAPQYGSNTQRSVQYHYHLIMFRNFLLIYSG